MKKGNIKTIWINTWFRDNQKKAEECFKEIEVRYNSKKRSYHNLAHIEVLFQLISQQNISREDQNLLYNVALFHDVIYNTLKSDNELKSAEFANKWLTKLNVKFEIIEKVYSIIKATKNHSSEDFITQLFLDMDLSILGSNQKDYSIYTKQIRSEYNLILYPLYKKGRIKFLKQQLELRTIFKTKFFIDKFEEQARINIKNELKSIK